MATMLPGDERDRFIPGVEESPLQALSGDPIMDADEFELDEQADGSVDVSTLGGEAPEQRQYNHYENLAEVLPENELATLARELLEKIEIDKQAKSKRDEQYAEGIKRSGLGNEAPGGADFEGASRAVHPMLAEACVDFATSAMRELFPSAGPVKTKIEGGHSPEKVEIANRQHKGLNWQLTEDMPEYAEELEQTLTQVPMGGSQYLHFHWEPRLGRVSCAFTPIDHYLIPYSASSFFSAERRTRLQPLTEMEYLERVDSGFYRDLAISPPALTPDETKAGEASNKVEGKEKPSQNIDGDRIVYEVDCYEVLSPDQQVDEDTDGKIGDFNPYLISIDEQAQRIVSIYRNWSPKDQRKKRLDWAVEFGFISWRGAYKIGLPQLIGGLSVAATGALRALLDSAHVNNVPSALLLKGTRITGQTKTIGVTELTEVDAGPNVDDIRKAAMPLPFNPPSTVLFQLLGWLGEQAKGVVTTAEEKIADASNSMPVGTSLALMESGAKVMSAIHARLHRSQRRALQIIARINSEHAQEFEQHQMEELGEVLAYGRDFAQPLSVIPVSDPNIFSEAQRYAQNQMVLQMAGIGAQQGVQYNMYAVHKRILEQAKIPNVEEVLPKPKGPQELNAAAENMSALMGGQIVAFPEQDHLSHLESHLRFSLDPMLGGSPLVTSRYMPIMAEHLMQHLGFMYVNEVHSIASDAYGKSMGDMLKEKGQGTNVDRLIAAASRLAHASVDDQLGNVEPILTSLFELAIKLKPKGPMDPVAAALEETERRRERDQGDLQIKSEQVRDDRNLGLQDNALKDKKITLDAKNNAAKVEVQREEARQAGNQIHDA